jgi:hypothetical protein
MWDKVKDIMYIVGEWIIIAIMVGCVYVFITLTLSAGGTYVPH